jgi:hypothetical protein
MANRISSEQIILKTFDFSQIEEIHKGIIKLAMSTFHYFLIFFNLSIIILEWMILNPRTKNIN